LLLIWGERVLAGEKPWLYRPDMVAAGWRGRERELGKKERGGDREGFFLFLPTSGRRVMIERERGEREVGVGDPLPDHNTREMVVGVW
jgi:hypothetical protein